MKPILIILFLSVVSTVFAQLPDDVNFIGLTSAKPLPDTLFMSPKYKDSLAKFFKVYKAHSLPVMIKSGRPEVQLSCNEVFALCLSVGKHTKVLLKTRLKNRGDSTEFEIDITEKLNKQVAKLHRGQTDYWQFRTREPAPYAKSKDTTKDILIINIFEELVRQYKEPEPKEMSCCPEKYNTNARLEAIRKVCELLSIKDGVKIEIQGGINAEYVNSVAFFNPDLMSTDGIDVPQIDPRKYVAIEEQRNNARKAETVWNNDIYYRHILDSRSQIKIRFKLDSLRDEIYFRGNVSLMATINDGDPIEIESFSVIGRDFATVGTKSESPYDFALSFLTEMTNIYELSKEKKFQQMDTAFKLNKYNTRVQKWLTNTDIFTKLHTAITDRIPTRKQTALKTSRWTMKLTSRQRKHVDGSFGHSQLYDSLSMKEYIADPVADIIDKITINRAKLTDSERRKKEALLTYLKAIMDSTKVSDPQLTDADTVAIGFQLYEFFHAANRDQLLQQLYSKLNTRQAINLDDLKTIVDGLKTTNKPSTSMATFLQEDYIDPMDYAIRHLKKTKDYFDKFLNTDDETFFAILTEIHRDSLFLIHAAQSIKDNYDALVALRSEMAILITSLSGQENLNYTTIASIDEKVQRFTNQMKRFLKTMEDLRKFEQQEYEEARKDYNSSHAEFDKHEFNKLWAKKLAIGAARHIYSKLLTGTIRLSARSIDEDSKLTIYVIKFKPSGEAEPPHPIAEFTLRRLGWNESVSDSFLLVNRNGATGNDRFKGAYGASLMWTYTSGERADFFQRLQPSFGINVAYLNFEPTAHTFEVGVAALLGLWKNKVFIGWGRNLHVDGNPTYFAVGFSFANIASRVSNGKNSD
jgi:hypothetical protein